MYQESMVQYSCTTCSPAGGSPCCSFWRGGAAPLLRDAAAHLLCAWSGSSGACNGSADALICRQEPAPWPVHIPPQGPARTCSWAGIAQSRSLWRTGWALIGQEQGREAAEELL